MPQIYIFVTPCIFFHPADSFISQVIFQRTCSLLRGVANKKPSFFFVFTRWLQIISCNRFFFPNKDFFFIQNEQHNVFDAVLIW